MDVKQTLSEVGLKVSKKVKEVLGDQLKDAKKYSPFLVEMNEHAISLSSKGKRLRGAFTYFSYKMFDGVNEDLALTAAAFAEIVQIHILMMDDILDEDDMRRGFPTSHYHFQEKHKKEFSKKDSRHFGECVAICSSLVLGYCAPRVLYYAGFDQTNLIKALNGFFGKMMLVGYGETLDVLAEVKDNVTIEEADIINYLKTATYTYEASLHLGATLSGASDEDLKILSEYAIPAGIAFQIQDDILGMFGDEEKLGKPADSDLKEGKMNVLTIKTLELAKKNDKKRFSELLGNKDIKPEDVEEAREIIKRSGALEFARDRARNYVLKARRVLKKFKHESEGKEFLDGIAEYMINRDV